MEAGEVGLHIPYVEVTAWDLGPDLVTTQVHLMEVEVVKAMTNISTDAVVEVVPVVPQGSGEVGHHGAHVAVTVWDLDQDLVMDLDVRVMQPILTLVVEEVAQVKLNAIWMK